MTKSEFYSRLRLEVNLIKEQYRDDNSAFLIWFLKNIYCLDTQTSVDSVCDGSRDKGIDGVWVDNQTEEIYIFQSEFSPYDNKDCGDKKIREFKGVSSWFVDENSVAKLSASLVNLELNNLLLNLKISEKISRGFIVKYVFVTNKIFDQNAKEFLETADIESHDIDLIFSKYTYFVEADVVNSSKILDLSNSSTIEYNSVSETPVLILTIPVRELLKLDGIQDHTLFSRNVRLWSGKTRVNNALAETIKNIFEHNKFFLYHNGISIICSNFEYDLAKSQLKIEGYQVINGCQSIISFYQNREMLTDNIVVLTKIIKVDPHSDLIQDITKNANNQNSISLKDLKSNDRVQIGLQREFLEFFGGKVFYNIKKGEQISEYDEVINIDLAGQLITAFYREEPHKTHLKTNFYSDKYEELFSRKMNCKKIYLAFLCYSVILDGLEKIDNLPVRGYGLARFSILRIIRVILEDDTLGKKIIDNPDDYLMGDNLEKLKKAMTKMFNLIALDLNSFISEYITEEEFFDYKNLFKNKEFVDKLKTSVLTSHKKTIVRHPEDKFVNIYNSFCK